MEHWSRNRGNRWEPSFEGDLKALGIAWEDFDEIAPEIDEVLCGTSDEILDLEYPERVDGLRLVLTEATWRVPALRIAFWVDEAEGGKICFSRVDLR